VAGTAAKGVSGISSVHAPLRVRVFIGNTSEYVFKIDLFTKYTIGQSFVKVNSLMVKIGLGLSIFHSSSADCTKILEFQNLQVPVANEVYMTGEQVCSMLHISSRTLQKLQDEKGIAYTVIGGKFLYPLSKLQSVLEKNYRSYLR